MLALWFLLADAYWMSKERKEEICVLDKATELVGKNLYPGFLHRYEYDNNSLMFMNARRMIGEQCGLIGGGGYYSWNHIYGLAYWEIILTLPVIHRYKFPKR